MYFASGCWSVYAFGCFVWLSADSDPEQLALTDQLFDAALGELSGVAWGLPLYVGWWFHCGAHQNSLLGKRDFGWALG